MNPYVTLLERCGFEVVRNEFQMYDIFHEGRMPEYDLMASHLEKFALEVGAKEAAGWLNANGWETLSRPFEPRWACQMRLDEYLSDLELIQEATKAGWEKGEGL